MKTRSLFITLLLLGSAFSFGQKVLTIDFDSIKIKTTDKSSNYYYPKLLERFVKADTTLTPKEFQYIYYGNVFAKDYNPYSMSDKEDKFMELYNKQKYKEAIPLGEKVLKENPVNPKILFKMLVCYNVLEDKPTAHFYANMYFPLIDAIYASGDGKSLETAYVVIKVGDEYEILADKEMYSTEQSLVGETDVLAAKNQDKKNGTEITKIYFNVNKPLDYLHQEFTKGKK